MIVRKNLQMVDKSISHSLILLFITVYFQIFGKNTAFVSQVEHFLSECNFSKLCPNATYDNVIEKMAL